MDMHQLMRVIPGTTLMDFVMNFFISSGYPGKKGLVRILLREIPSLG